jgi:sugar O-acyltransferase (sialic acid O-acetyltransferase NeuD family)
MSTSCLALVGNGGHSIVVRGLAVSLGYEICSVVEFYGREQSAKFQDLIFAENTVGNGHEHFSGHRWALAVGDNDLRFKLLEAISCLDDSARFPTLISDRAHVSSVARVGRGSVVLSGSNVGPAASIGEFTIINSLSNVEHDVRVADFSHLAPGSVALGGAYIGNSVFIGANSVVGPGVRVENKITVGALSFINRDLGSPGVYVGIPARVQPPENSETATD